MEFTLFTPQEYIEQERFKDLPQEVKDEIVRIRSTYEYMNWEIWKGLLEQRQICRTHKLKKPRTLWVDEDGKIWYFSHYSQSFVYAGFFHSPEFLQERAEKEESERREIEERREKKKQLKAEAHAAKNKKPEVIVKKKRKRIVR